MIFSIFPSFIFCYSNDFYIRNEKSQKGVITKKGGEGRGGEREWDVGSIFSSKQLLFQRNSSNYYGRAQPWETLMIISRKTFILSRPQIHPHTPHSRNLVQDKQPESNPMNGLPSSWFTRTGSPRPVFCYWLSQAEQ